MANRTVDADWASASCIEHPDMFTFASQSGTGQAGLRARAHCREICLACPVFEACEEETFRFKDDRTFRAGRSPRELRVWFNKRKKAA